MNNERPRDIAEKVEELKKWLSKQMGAEVEVLKKTKMHRILWFRVHLQDDQSKDVPTPPMLGISEERLEEGRPIDEILGDLGREKVPERLKNEPEQALCYSWVGEGEKCDPRRSIG